MVDLEWIESWPRYVAPYATLLQAFIDGRISADEIEVVYFQMHSHDDTRWTPEAARVIGSFASEAEDLVTSPEIIRRDPHHVTAEGLRDYAIKTLWELRSIDVYYYPVLMPWETRDARPAAEE